jgi:pyruvate dehydrogenase E2 component (dihydrolipoamide acetyltransferase)
MATAVELPQLGNTVEECLITRWVKRKGDSVSAGEVVVEIETDKTTFEVTAPSGGTVLETFFEEGALVPVFTKIFVIGEAGERLGQAAQHDPQAADRGSAPFSPRARRFAEAHDFHPAQVRGSGPGGRVLESDLRRAYDAGAKPPAGSSLRAAIARRMRESLASTAQYTLHASAAAAGLLALRARLKASRGPIDITIGDLVTFCTVQALLEAPELNAEYAGGRIVRHTGVHIGFACDTPRGLVAPVVRDAHTLSIAGLAARVKELTEQAVQGTIAPDALSGGTFTISNLGGLGIESFTPVINLPQVAILGVGSIQLKPVRRDGLVEFVDSIGLSLTCDHQAIDGAPGARFLRTLRGKIENVEEISGI